MQLTRQSGVSLVEVITAVVVLALGLIGAAGLQWRALRAAHEAGLQSAASRIAADLAENMRAYHDWSLAQGRDNPFANFAYDSASGPETPVQSCFATVCTPMQFAAFERQDVARRVRELLPEGRVLVCRDARPWDPVRQALSWDCSGPGSPIAPLVIKLGWRSREGQPEAAILPLLVLAALP